MGFWIPFFGICQTIITNSNSTNDKYMAICGYSYQNNIFKPNDIDSEKCQKMIIPWITGFTIYPNDKSPFV